MNAKSMLKYVLLALVTLLVLFAYSKAQAFWPGSVSFYDKYEVSFLAEAGEEVGEDAVELEEEQEEEEEEVQEEEENDKESEKEQSAESYYAPTHRSRGLFGRLFRRR